MLLSSIEEEFEASDVFFCDSGCAASMIRGAAPVEVVEVPRATFLVTTSLGEATMEEDFVGDKTPKAATLEMNQGVH